MPCTARLALGGTAFHVLNQGVGQMQLFEKEGSYQAFEAVLAETLVLRPMRLLACCIMPNHWHRVHWLKADGDLESLKATGIP